MSPYREPGLPRPIPFTRSRWERWWRRTRARVQRQFVDKNPYCPNCRRRHTDWSYLSSGPWLCWKCFERRAVPAMQRFIATKR